MLRLFLVTAPAHPTPALAAALEGTPLTEVYAPPDLLAHAAALGAPHALRGVAEPRLDAPEGASAFIEEVAGRIEGSVAAVVGEAVARAVVSHALAIPLVGERVAFDPGAYAEIEVRLDAPWTVNRLNDRCHEDGARALP